MATDVQTTKYRCPKCGKKHAADLSALEGHPEIHGKVHCMKCHELLWLSLGEDGSPRVEIYADHLRHMESEAAASANRPAAAASAPESSTTVKKPSSLGPILAAALVAAIVSFLVGQATGGGKQDELRGSAGVREAGGSEDTGSEAASEALGALQADLQALRSDAGAAASAHAKFEAELRSAVDAQTGALDGMNATLGELRATLDAIRARLAKVEASYDGLHGRIEMNYNNLRAATKRMDALEGEK